MARNNYWNKRFEKGQIYGLRESKIVRFYFRYLEKDDRLLEIGGGGGRDSAWLAEKGFKNIICTDVSENAINAAIKSFQNLGILFEAKDISNIGYAAGRFESIFSVYAMSLFTCEERNGIFQQARMLLVPKGKFFNNFLSLDDSEYNKGRKIGKNMFNPEDVQSIQFFSMNDVIMLHENNGFRIAKIKKIEEERLLFGKRDISRSWAVFAEKTD